MIPLGTYYTHFNGDRPYAVRVWPKDESGRQLVEVLEAPYDTITETFDCRHVYFGVNTLLELSHYEYVLISHKISRFETLFPIVDFKPILGNNDVPYSYAIDTVNNCYLLSENVYFKLDDSIDYPYEHYYNKCLITEDIAYIPAKQPLEPFKNIKKFYIGSEQYTLTYISRNYSELYDRLSLFNNDVPEELYVVLHTGEKQLLTKEMFVELMTEFAEKNGFNKITHS